MLSAAGCKQRRQRLLAKLDPKPDNNPLRLTDPINLMYLANFYVDPFSLGGGFGGILLLRNDGYAKLLHDDRMPESVNEAHVDEVEVVPWYDAQSPAHGPRQLALLSALHPTQSGLRIHDRPGDPYAPTLIDIIADMRRQKDPDEIDLMKRCMRAGEAGHAWHDRARGLYRRQRRVRPSGETCSHRLW